MSLSKCWLFTHQMETRHVRTKIQTQDYILIQFGIKLRHVRWHRKLNGVKYFTTMAGEIFTITLKWHVYLDSVVLSVFHHSRSLTDRGIQGCHSPHRYRMNCLQSTRQDYSCQCLWKCIEIERHRDIS